MKTPSIKFAAALVATLACVACGSDPKPETETTDPGDESGATSESESSSAPSPEPSAPRPGRPVLEELPPQTQLSDLDDDQLEQVCSAYVATATAVNESLGDLCPAQALFQSTQGAEDDDALRAACAENLSACEDQVDEAQAQTPEERCEAAADCDATIQEFNECNRQIAALNQSLLLPLSEQSIPECSEITLSRAQSLSTALTFQAVLGLGAVTNETGGNPTDEGGPCQRINEACPELGVSLGAFSDLAEMLQ